MDLLLLLLFCLLGVFVFCLFGIQGMILFYLSSAPDEDHVSKVLVFLIVLFVVV